MKPATVVAALEAAARATKRAGDLQRQAAGELRRAAGDAHVIGHVRIRSDSERDRALDLVRVAAHGHDDIHVVVINQHPRPHQHGAKEQP